jgi:hypothetical protein
MDRTWYHNIKQNQLDSKGQIVHVFSQMQNLDLKKIHECKRATWGQGAPGEGNAKGEQSMMAGEYDQSTLCACLKIE